MIECRAASVHLPPFLLRPNSSSPRFYFPAPAPKKQVGNLATCATFCRRLLELNPPEAVRLKARQVLAACEKAPADKLPLAYDPRNPFVVCAATHVPIYRGHRDVACPTCGAKYVPAEAGSTCAVCTLGKVGAEGGGIVCSHTQTR